MLGVQPGLIAGDQLLQLFSINDPLLLGIFKVRLEVLDISCEFTGGLIHIFQDLRHFAIK